METAKKNYDELLERLRLKELDNTAYISNVYVNDDHEFVWYKINSEIDYNIINSVYGHEVHLAAPKEYPEMVCVDMEGGEPHHVEYLSDMKTAMDNFWDKLGYHVILSQKEHVYKHLPIGTTIDVVYGLDTGNQYEIISSFEAINMRESGYRAIDKNGEEVFFTLEELHSIYYNVNI